MAIWQGASRRKKAGLVLLAYSSSSRYGPLDFVDATFSLNVLSMLVLALSVTLALRVVIWTRNGLLT